MSSGYTLFETPFGRCGIAWENDAIAAIQLAESSDRATARKLLARRPELELRTPPPWVSEAAGMIRSHLAGEPQDFTRLPLALGGLPDFHRRAYEAARAVPGGATITYGELAARVGSPGAARAVGQAMSRNPFILVVPCHRVLGSGGALGGFSAKGGTRTKERLLGLERRACAPGDGGEKESDPAAHGLAYDPAEAARHLAKADPRLGRVIRRVGAPTLRARPAHPFEALAQAVAHQQLAGAAARTIVERLKGLFPERPFPSPEDIRGARTQRLRRAGLSGPKILSIKDLARAALDGTIPSLEGLREMSDEAIVERLDPIRGIGRWTVEMLLIFRLGRPDVLPIDDFGVRKGFQAAFGLREMPSPREVLERGERWKPYRSLASWYLWRAAEKK